MPDLARWERQCARADLMEPVRIRCQLGSPLCTRGTTPCVHLDALLAFVALHAMRYPGHDLPWAPVVGDEMLEIPLPLAQHHSGVYQCSMLWPETGPRASAAGFIQRPTTEHMHLVAARSVPVLHGVTRQRRKLVELWPVRSLIAYAVGRPDQIRRLLRRVPSVGHRRGQGYGRVVGWVVEPCDQPDAWASWDGVARRPIPAAGGMVQGVRPPYWFRDWWEPAVTPGDPLPAGAP
jgi:hypothetical protein